MVAWRAAFWVDEAAPCDALINWHERWLWPTLHHLNHLGLLASLPKVSQRL